MDAGSKHRPAPKAQGPGEEVPSNGQALGKEAEGKQERASRHEILE